MKPNTPNTPSTTEVREIATAYALECKAKNCQPSFSEMGRRLGKNPQWLLPRTAQSVAAQIARAETIKTWIKMDISISSVTGPGRAVADDDDDIPATPLPASPIAGDDLYGILNHPGRLAMFCRLTESGGIGAALRYAQKQHERIYAQPTKTTA
jgi:hypothetical protein